MAEATGSGSAQEGGASLSTHRHIGGNHVAHEVGLDRDNHLSAALVSVQ